MATPVIGVVGYKNNGKTRLVTRLLRTLAGRGLKISTIKHTHHSVDLDRPGKDSHQHREAGAQETVIASAARFAILHEYRDAPELELEALLERLEPVDLVIVEGFKAHSHPKIEAHFSKSGTPLLAPNDSMIWAIVSDAALDVGDRPVFDPDDTDRLCDFILERLELGG
jgi:molybdopterin-guanine dinucleotide biosynthesis protein MobB